MAEKVKLNKNTLREQKQNLSLYKEFLPTLELRKQQLQTELQKLDKLVEQKQAELDALIQDGSPWSPMLDKTLPWVRPLVGIDEVVTHVGNVAGVKVPVFDEVRFSPITILGIL